jgi:uncharacterized protein YyaL (SSP411 family)
MGYMNCLSKEEMEKLNYTNRLINETSPYLLQHAHNPVDWYPWGNDAFEIAKKEDKPVLVSIGYAACHWCHVMERESFEDEDTAQLMNRHFVNIKIDREERPDIDQIYMDAVQAMTGSGGWPLNVFLTPDAKPFYGGTYFPPTRAYNRSSWREILEAIHEAYTQKKDEIESQATNLTEHIKNANAFGVRKSASGEAFFSETSLHLVAKNLLKSGDKTWGGFGRAPKFPQTFSIQFLLRNYYFTRDEDSLKQALLSLDKMIYGGIFDQLGGGFARYSTDEQWLAPHFEKMLYDNALIVNVIAEAFQLTGKKLYEQAIHHTFDFIEREMMHEEGGFFSALDADSEGVEGKFYTWSKEEVNELLQDDAEMFCQYYDIRKAGNWEHTNILWITRSLEDFAAEKSIPVNELRDTLEACKAKLFERRNTRIRPSLDDKILLNWNALMNTACCKAYAATGRERYKEIAIRNAAFIEASFVEAGTGKWRHTYKNGHAKYAAFLDDFAYLINAYIHLQEITANPTYLTRAKKLTEIVMKDFVEESTGFFFFTSHSQNDVIFRKKEVHDGATPSGNSMMAMNLQYLGLVYNNAGWIEHAGRLAKQLGDVIAKHPLSFGNWACLLQQIVQGVPEIAITGENAFEMLPRVMKEYIPVKVLQAAKGPLEDFPLIRGKAFERMQKFTFVKTIPVKSQ